MLRVSFSRVYQFSSAHRLHSDLMNDRDNVHVYDKCNNINGHGHDYTVEVTLRADPDPETGMVYALEEFDSSVQEVLSELDYKHLDNEVPFFRDHISTGEVIIRYLWIRLEERFPEGVLYHLKLWETNNNYFELGKEH